MNNKVYTITLSDGSTIENLSLNGNNFVSQTEITDAMFKNKLANVQISDGETIERHKNMELIQIAKYNDGWYFIIRDIPEAELKVDKMRSDLEYVAMMAGIDI